MGIKKKKDFYYKISIEENKNNSCFSLDEL